MERRSVLTVFSTSAILVPAEAYLVTMRRLSHYTINLLVPGVVGYLVLPTSHSAPMAMSMS